MTLTDLYMKKTAGVGSAILGGAGHQAFQGGVAAIKGAKGFTPTMKAGWEGAKSTFKNLGAKRQVAAVGVPAIGAGYALGKKNSPQE